MTDGLGTSITVERYVGTEKAFDPEAVKVQFELKKIEKYLLPQEIDLSEKPTARPYDKKGVMLNIETTGLFPWEWQMFSIAVLDMEMPEDAPQVWVHEDEETLVRNFMAWYEAQDFEEIWGYNVNFDVRGLMAACMRYRIQAPKFMATKSHDVMDLMQKGTEDYVTTLNKRGTLDQWGIYLLGRGKIVPQEDVFEWWENRELEKIVEFNANQVLLTYELWLLYQFTTGVYESLPEELIPAGSEEGSGQKKLETCPECGQVNEISKEAEEYTCGGCERTISL